MTRDRGKSDPRSDHDAPTPIPDHFAAGAACLPAARPSHAAGSEYHRPSTDWLAKCRYGVGVHWTAQTIPRTGRPLPFQESVEAFDLKRFLDAVAHAGADYVLFTAAHALQMLPAPHPVLDRLLPGRTYKRDPIDELAMGLATRGIPLLIYYNHSCNQGQDQSVCVAGKS